jgi:Protein of unknown function (DUF1553)/Protein of unknown function (DUF1549)/Planctomycete cytochrome C
MARFIFVTLVCCLVAISTRASEPLRFNRDIRSILTDKCFACHGPDAKTVEGDLRLDLREKAIESGAIVPGKPEESELLQRIFATDAAELMPPAKAHKPLTDAERDRLKQWISEGAEYELHWAYTTVRRPETDGQTSSAAIDQLISRNLAAKGIEPTPTADKVTLIRRLSLDLTGLPPTPAEVDQFVNDPSPDAYQQLVNRLLESPRYGERMAIYWLDLVRYADTVGYHGDQNVSQSPFRDYVIKAFNDNMPYDQFVREQLAGDLLPNATLSQRVASGYNRLNQTTEEGGAQAKEYLSIYFADRVRNVSQVFMGATVGCAQCHDHKYDPYTTRDFYSLGAFFADLDERGVYGGRERNPMIRVPNEQQAADLQAADQKIADLKARTPILREELLAQQADWEAALIKRLDEPREVEATWVDDAQDTGGNQSGSWDFVGSDVAPVHSGANSRRQQSDGLVQHFFEGAKTKVKITPTSRFYAWVYLDPKNPPKALMLQLNDGNWNHRSVWGSEDISYGRQPESYPAYRRAGELPPTEQWVRLEVAAADVGLAEGSEVNGMAFTQFGGLAYWDKAGWISSEIPREVADALVIEPAQRNEAQTKAVQEHLLVTAPAMIELQQQVADAEAARLRVEESAPLTVVSKSVSPREIRVLPRGNWLDDSGEVVQPAIPAFLGQLPAEGRLTRLDLANWLCTPENPLTSRTMVNRLWSLLFGRGICASVDDFGGQGTFPTHPDLLDWLATEFVQSGWDIKHTVRLIVNSEAYKRSSKPTAELRANDPYNDWFARQGRFRIEAEMVRDMALLVSGLLTEQVGGQSVHPYQPDGYYAQLNFPKRTYMSDAGPNQYRRGVYTHWQRTFLHPMLKAFDAPSREECTAARERSNTPLQALAMLNDPSFVEAARVFAARIMTEGGAQTQPRIAWAYRNVVSQHPETEIAAELAQLFNQHHEYYRQHLDEAQQLIREGTAPVNEQLDAAELAAWTSVARAILNLHEAIMRY